MRGSALIAAALVVVGFAACDEDALTRPDPDFVADLSVGAEVPPVDHPTSASGRAEFVFDGDDNGMSFIIEVSDMTDVLTAHIHGPASAAQGGAGILVTLFIAPLGGTGDVDGRLVSGSFTEPDEQAHMSMDSLPR